MPARLTLAWVYGGLAASCGLSLVVRWWMIRSRRRDRLGPSDLAQVRMVDKLCDAEVNVTELLRSTHGQAKWLVAHDRGRYMLFVGQRRIDVDVKATEEFNLVLSHRWHPVVDTNMGQVPLHMLQASYPEPTWIDFINHMNQAEFCPTVLERMGELYATKACRALYFEGRTSLATQLECCSRMWMWQELSLGMQRHAYNCAEAVWLHHAVRLGPVSAGNLCFALLRLTWRLSALSLHATSTPEASRRRGWGALLRGVERVAGHPRRALLGQLAGCFMEKDAEMLTQGGMLGACNEGAVRAMLERLFEEEAALGEGSGELAVVLAEEVEGAGARSEQLWAAGQLTCEAATMLAEATHGLSGARGLGRVAQEGFSSIARMARVARALTGRRRVSQGLSMRMVGSGRALEGKRVEVGSALENFVSRNITHREDRLVASFGVLASKCGVACSAAGVEGLLERERRVCVPTVGRQDACGIASVTRKRVCVRGSGFRSMLGWAERVGLWLVMGPLEHGRLERLSLSGWEQEDVFVAWAGPGAWEQWTGAPLEGHVAMYRFGDEGEGGTEAMWDNGAVNVHLDMAGGGTFSVRPEVSREKFRAWLASLPDSEDGDVAGGEA